MLANSQRTAKTNLKHVLAERKRKRREAGVPQRPTRRYPIDDWKKGQMPDLQQKEAEIDAAPADRSSYLGFDGVEWGSCFEPHPHFRPDPETTEIALPIINLGFPKAGTTSFQNFWSAASRSGTLAISSADTNPCYLTIVSKRLEITAADASPMRCGIKRLLMASATLCIGVAITTPLHKLICHRDPENAFGHKLICWKLFTTFAQRLHLHSATVRLISGTPVCRNGINITCDWPNANWENTLVVFWTRRLIHDGIKTCQGFELRSRNFIANK